MRGEATGDDRGSAHRGHREENWQTGVRRDRGLASEESDAQVALLRREQGDFDGGIPGTCTVVAVQDAWGSDWMEGGGAGRKQLQHMRLGRLRAGKGRFASTAMVRARWYLAAICITGPAG